MKLKINLNIFYQNMKVIVRAKAWLIKKFKTTTDLNNLNNSNSIVMI